MSEKKKDPKKKEPDILLKNPPRAANVFNCGNSSRVGLIEVAFRQCPVELSQLEKSKREKKKRRNLPDGEDTTSLVEISLARDTADALLKDGRDLGRGGLGLGKASSGNGDTGLQKSY